MSFSRKIIRNAAKSELRECGYSRPNKLAYHMEHGVDVYKMAIDRLTDIHLYGRSRHARKAKRRRRA